MPGEDEAVGEPVKHKGWMWSWCVVLLIPLEVVLAASLLLPKLFCWRAAM